MASAIFCAFQLVLVGRAMQTVGRPSFWFWYSPLPAAWLRLFWRFFAALAAANVLGERLSLPGMIRLRAHSSAVLAVQIVPRIAGIASKSDPALP